MDQLAIPTKAQDTEINTPKGEGRSNNAEATSLKLMEGVGGQEDARLKAEGIRCFRTTESENGSSEDPGSSELLQKNIGSNTAFDRGVTKYPEAQRARSPVKLREVEGPQRVANAQRAYVRSILQTKKSKQEPPFVPHGAYELSRKAEATRKARGVKMPGSNPSRTKVRKQVPRRTKIKR